MHRSLRALTRTVAVVALVATVAFGFASPASADDWARDEVAAQALASLDPAIRTAIAQRAVDTTPTADTAVAPQVADGFAWGAAALGLGTGIAAMCAVFGCVTLVRHDGRLRNA
jgi:hypothetical protein